MLSSGLTKKTFYDPGTEPRFGDKENWAGPGVAPAGPSSTLWNYDATGSFHIIGYALAFNGAASKLDPTNQNTTLQPEVIKMGGVAMKMQSASRILIADSILSVNAAMPGYQNVGNIYNYVPGGFEVNNTIYPHTSPHLKNQAPQGGDAGYKDGHAEWHKFDVMTPRTSANDPYFWW
jgi:hypothetical protein